MALRGGLARPLRLAARGSVGGRDLRALRGPRPGDGAGRLGPRAAQARARGRVRRPRSPAPARARATAPRLRARNRLRGQRRAPPGVRRRTGRVARSTSGSTRSASPWGSRSGSACGDEARARPRRRPRRHAASLGGLARGRLAPARVDCDARPRLAFPRSRGRCEGARSLGRARDRRLARLARPLRARITRRSTSGPRPRSAPLSRRLEAAGAQLGAFTDAPRELAEVALAHLGAPGGSRRSRPARERSSACSSGWAPERGSSGRPPSSPRPRTRIHGMEGKDVGDRQLDALLERLDSIHASCAPSTAGSRPARTSLRSCTRSRS